MNIPTLSGGNKGMSLDTKGGPVIGGDVGTQGGSFTGRDATETTQDGLNTMSGGSGNKQATTTTTTTTTVQEAPMVEATNTFYLPVAPQPLPPTNDTIILYLMQQNNFMIKLDNSISGLDTKLENQVTVLFNRLGGLEEKLSIQNTQHNNRMTGLEQANNAVMVLVANLANRLKILTDSNLELEHLSKKRGLQSDELEIKLRELSGLFVKLSKEVSAMPEKGINAKALGYAFLLLLALGVSFMLGAGVYILGWRF